MTRLDTSIDLSVFPPGGAASSSLCRLGAWTCGKKRERPPIKVLATSNPGPGHELYSIEHAASRSAWGKLYHQHEPPIILPRPAKPNRVSRAGPRVGSLSRRSRNDSPMPTYFDGDDCHLKIMVCPAAAFGAVLKSLFAPKFLAPQRSPCRKIPSNARCLGISNAGRVPCPSLPGRTSQRQDHTASNHALFPYLCMQSDNSTIYG